LLSYTDLVKGILLKKFIYVALTVGEERERIINAAQNIGHQNHSSNLLCHSTDWCGSALALNVMIPSME
jgi:hypothetical protein